MFKHIQIKTINKNGINENLESFVSDSEIRIKINDYATIHFICLAENLDFLVYGYLRDLKDIKISKIENNDIFVKTTLSKNEVLDLITQKEIVGTCESIEITNLKAESKKIVIPFNNTRYKLKSDILLEICNDFYKNIEGKLYHARIISLESLAFVDCKDTNIKTNIYKILGKSKDYDLLLCAILLDCKMNTEILQILIKSKITFIIAKEIENFATLKLAQKFGLTIGYFCAGEIRILSHSSRII